MKKFILLLLLSTVGTQAKVNLFSPEETCYPEPVRAELLSLGAQEVTFTTTDDVAVKALYVERPQAPATIIVSPGFLMLKEFYAAFVLHFPEHNILLIDPRGQGESGGTRWWQSMLTYGLHDYLDVVAAVHFVSEKTHKPIVVYGSCAGAFNAARALIHLQKNNLISHFNVKGFIFESGWHSVANAGVSAALGLTSSSIFEYLQGKAPNPSQAEHPTLRKALSTLQKTKIFSRTYATCKEAMHLMHWLVGDHMTDLDEKVDIAKDLRTLPLPIFFIHALDDHYIPFTSAYLLSTTIKDAHCWWIGKGASWHVRHHCYLGDEFRSKVGDFCRYALKK